MLKLFLLTVILFLLCDDASAQQKPSKPVFNHLSNRDCVNPEVERTLREHFMGYTLDATKMQCELLLEEPVAGLTTKQYYLWVTIINPYYRQQGAMKLWVLEGERYKVEKYMSSRILDTPDYIEKNFPSSIVGKVREYAKNAIRWDNL